MDGTARGDTEGFTSRERAAPREEDASRAGLRPIWLVVGALAGLVALALPARGMRFEPFGLVLAMGLCAAFLALSVLYTRLRPDPRLARLLRGCAELFLLTFLPGVLSYAGASLALPLWDGTFLAWDRSLGFAWRDWLAVVDANPRAHLALVVAYHTMLPQMAVALVALVTVRAWREADAFLLALGLAAAITVAVSTAMPAMSPLIHLGITPADHPGVRLAVGPEFADQVRALRDGSLRVIDVTKGDGIVAFPSFHTASGVLFAFAFWRVPYLRWAGLALNGGLLLAVPIEGSHYLVDLLAGVLVALVARALALRLLDRAPAAAPARAALPA